jgi:hypothetical protein
MVGGERRNLEPEPSRAGLERRLRAIKMVGGERVELPTSSV